MDVESMAVFALLCFLALGACAEPDAAEHPKYGRYELDYDGLAALSMEHASSNGPGTASGSVALNDVQLARATRQLSFRLRESRVLFDLHRDGSWTWTRTGGRAPAEVAGTWNLEGSGQLRLVPQGDLVKPFTAEYEGDELRFPKRTLPGGAPVQVAYRVVATRDHPDSLGSTGSSSGASQQSFYLVDVGLEIVVTLSEPREFELRATFDPYSKPQTLELKGEYQERNGVSSVAIRRFLDSTGSTVAADHSLQFTQQPGESLALMWPNVIPTPLILRHFH